MAGPPAGRPSFRRALAQRPFLLLWTSQLVSQSGDYVFDVALLWLVLEATHSVFAVGLVVTASIAPGVLLGPFLGVYVDRWSRRSLLVLTNGVEAVLVAVLAGLVVGHAVALVGVLAVVAALGAGAQVVRVASSALVPQTVGRDDLAPANSLLSFSSSFNQVVGFAVGGVVVALLGPGLPIEYDALTFVVAALLVAAIPRAVAAPAPAPEGARPGFRAQFAEGIGYVRSQPFLVQAILLGVVVNFFANAVSALWAPYAALVLHGGAATYGLLGAAVAAGAIVGALAVGKVDARRRAGRYLFAGAGTVGAAIAVLGLTRSTPVALGVTFGLGVALSFANVPMLAVIQGKVPARLMGRVLAVLMSLIPGTGPLGAFFAGALARAIGVGPVFLAAGVAILLGIAVGAFAMRELREVRY